MNELFARRTAAYFLDCTICFGVVMLVIQWAILTPLRQHMGITDEWFHNSWNLQAYIWLSISLPVWMYFTFLDSRLFKGTPAKRLFKIAVISESSGSRLAPDKALLRTVCKLLPWEVAHIGLVFPEPIYFAEEPILNPLVYVGIGLFVFYVATILKDERGRAIYDRILGAAVVSTK